jgi:hypothetical protein
MKHETICVALKKMLIMSWRDGCMICLCIQVAFGRQPLFVALKQQVLLPPVAPDKALNCDTKHRRERHCFGACKVQRESRVACHCDKTLRDQNQNFKYVACDKFI